jgi:phosphoribosylformylglycinamidine (FGAM) synthase-like amidotransferase family enzyme
MAGGRATRLHLNALRDNPRLLRDYQILMLPGGFSYGDDVAAGKVQALYMQHFLSDALRQFRDDEKLILGICNGFQALLKSGILVPPDEDGPLATLTANDSGRYEDRWISMQATPGKCPFLKGIDRIHLPIGHGEGKFLCRKEWIVRGLDQAEQVVLRYVDANGRRGGYQSIRTVPRTTLPASATQPAGRWASCRTRTGTFSRPSIPNGRAGGSPRKARGSRYSATPSHSSINKPNRTVKVRRYGGEKIRRIPQKDFPAAANPSSCG